jgi:hypothetical protein
MKQSARVSRTPSILPATVHHQLNMYTLAASAAGVSLLALAQTAEAKIVYTKTNQVIGKNGVYELDLNRDGNIDFLIRQHGYSNSSSGVYGLYAQNALGNAVQGSANSMFKLASALPRGAQIGPGQNFVSSHSRGEIMVRVLNSFTHSNVVGKWVNVQNRYLGLKFDISGKTHYGWARLTVQRVGRLHITATLTGYAYETIADSGLRAGQMHGDASSTDTTAGEKVFGHEAMASASIGAGQGGSLGKLALGAQAAMIRRNS